MDERKNEKDDQDERLQFQLKPYKDWMVSAGEFMKITSMLIEQEEVDRQSLSLIGQKMKGNQVHEQMLSAQGKR